MWWLVWCITHVSVGATIRGQLVVQPRLVPSPGCRPPPRGEGAGDAVKLSCQDHVATSFVATVVPDAHCGTFHASRDIPMHICILAERSYSARALFDWRTGVAWSSHSDQAPWVIRNASSFGSRSGNGRRSGFSAVDGSRSGLDVAGPVSLQSTDPPDRGVDVQAEQVGKDRRWEICGEADERAVAC